ncbi:MAG: M20/M25/M40 family metallo-hydrolase [Odoribacteraceae bacterium]|jgi:acetylornithine deacetylase|nr:M20/M25/M40 family metallo-hydrolase [Odoribacteraceae bacterium]
MNSAEAIQLLERIIAIPSFSKEEGGVADLIQSLLADSGHAPHRSGNNVWVDAPGYIPTRPTILLDAHVDTVHPTGAWESDPFTPLRRDGKIFGLGSNDDGGSLVSMLAVFLRLAARPRPYNLTFSASAEEENTGAGGIQSILPSLGRIDLALIGEPTGMHPAIAEKGLMVLDCTARGVAGHAAREEGVNAIYAAMSDIDWFRAHRFPRVSPLLGAVKTTVTGITAGTLHNVVPAECRFVVDVRVNELYTNQEILETIRAGVACEVAPRSVTLNSSSISPEHPVVRRCLSLGREPYASPTTSNQAVIPFTSLKIGPGDSARSHAANEYIATREIEEGIDLYEKILDNLNILP